MSLHSRRMYTPHSTPPPRSNISFAPRGGAATGEEGKDSVSRERRVGVEEQLRLRGPRTLTADREGERHVQIRERSHKLSRLSATSTSFLYYVLTESRKRLSASSAILSRFRTATRDRTYHLALPFSANDPPSNTNAISYIDDISRLKLDLLKFQLIHIVPRAQSRDTKATLALSRIFPQLSNSPWALAWSMGPRYGSTVQPRIIGFGRETLRVAKVPVKVQTLVACKLSTGALRTTVMDTIDFHGNILANHISLNRTVSNVDTRLTTLSRTPLHHTVRRCRRVPMYPHSPIHHIMSAFFALHGDFKITDPHFSIAMIPPDALSSHILPTKEIATAEMEDETRMDKEGENKIKHLGAETEHTIFECEVVGTIIALDIVKNLTSVDIFTVSQPAIIALVAPKSQPDQFVITDGLHYHSPSPPPRPHNRQSAISPGPGPCRYPLASVTVFLFDTAAPSNAVGRTNKNLTCVTQIPTLSSPVPPRPFPDGPPASSPRQYLMSCPLILPAVLPPMARHDPPLRDRHLVSPFR
ncbi:hypothetical protein C8R43DRAFT_942402 [Mycena crocata]|nr:hypothetical protein C8R43DRAFT_942402 [Mycena crocata]